MMRNNHRMSPTRKVQATKSWAGPGISSSPCLHVDQPLAAVEKNLHGCEIKSGRRPGEEASHVSVVNAHACDYQNTSRSYRVSITALMRRCAHRVQNKLLKQKNLSYVLCSRAQLMATSYRIWSAALANFAVVLSISQFGK